MNERIKATIWNEFFHERETGQLGDSICGICAFHK